MAALLEKSPPLVKTGGGELSALRVSQYSFWTDATWIFPAITAGTKAAVVNWAFTLEGGLFSDPEYSNMLDRAKRILWSVRVASQRGRNPKSLTVLGYFFRLRSLIRWMVRVGLRQFSDLTPTRSALYAEEMAERLRARSTLTEMTLGSYVDTLCRIHEQAPLLVEFPDAVIVEHPFNGRSANDVALSFDPERREGIIPPLPDPIFLGATQAAVTWLGSRSDDVIELQDAYLQERKKYERRTSNSYSWHLNRFLADFAFNGGDRLAEHWRPPLTTDRAMGELANLVKDVRDAGVAGVQAILGLRISEICGIQAGVMQPGELWPSCITVQPSISGLNELFQLHGRVYKENDEYDEVTWLAGSRPAGTEHIPLAVQFITMLWRIMRPWRAVSGRTDLLVSLRTNGRGLPWKPKEVGRIRSATLARSQRSWLEAEVDVPAGLVGWRVTTHQWRKNFAMYMVRSDKRLLPGVRDHFKHLSSAMTERGYLGRDPEMLGMLDDEATHAAAQTLFDAVSGRKAAGKMMDVIEANADKIRRFAGSTGRDQDKVQRIADLLKGDKIRVWPSDWGKCFFRAERARCHWRANGDFDLSAQRPHYGERRPGVCCDCANLLVFTDDIEFWTSRYASALACFEANRMANEHAAAGVEFDRLVTAGKILGKLGVQVTIPESMPVLSTEDMYEFQ